ncbi:MAG: hypothetical protein ACI4MN_01270 [Candidatus Coproplasma sp.]
MSIFDKFKRNKDDEAAVSSVQNAEEESGDVEFSEHNEKQDKSKKSSVKKVVDAIDVAKNAYTDVVEPFYVSWIKPIRDNWPQIKRRWNALVTIVSIVFFLLYVPMLLFTKIANGLSLGWDIALYVCLGVYVVSFIIMIAVYIASSKSASTKASKRRKRAFKVIMLVLRIASVALSITAIAVSGVSEYIVLDTILLVIAITSIVFTSLSLVFDGLIGFIKWLVSPAKKRRKFSFVAFEWKQALDEGRREQNKKAKKAYDKNSARVAECLDNHLLPFFGKAYIDAIDGNNIKSFLETLPEDDKNVCEWVFKDMFEYAVICNYIKKNPCKGLGLSGDIAKEKPPKRKKEGGRLSRFKSLFKRKEKVAETEEDEEDVTDGD